MTPQQLRSVRTFFIQNDKAIDSIVNRTFANFFAQAPAGATLFRDELENHRDAFARMLRKIIDLTRASHLWPVSAQSGQAIVPGIADLRERHLGMGVTAEHAEAMKQAMMQAIEKTCPSSFTGEVREHFAQFYDILAHSLTAARWRGMACGAELDSLLDRERDVPAGSFDAFFGRCAGTVSQDA